MSERMGLPDWESELDAPVSLPDVTYGDDMQLRFAAAEWSQIHNRRMPAEGVSRVLGLRALDGSSFSVQFDTDNDFERDATLKASAVQDVIAAERNRKDQAPEGNTLAAMLLNGKPAQIEEKRTQLDGVEVARACREGDLFWREVPKRMFVDIWYGQSVYHASANDYVSRQELVTYGVQLRHWGDGVFKVLKPMYMVGARKTDRLDVGRNLQLDAWANTLKQGMRVRCLSGEGQSELALARAPLTIIESSAASPADSELLREQRALVHGTQDNLDPVEGKKATRVLNIDFGGAPANTYDVREALRVRAKRELAEPARHGRTVLDGLRGGYAVTD